MKNVEGVQHRATKLILELRDKPYQERLQSLNLFSMEYRRKGGYMIQAYKILKMIDIIDPNKFFIQTKYKGTRSHSIVISAMDDRYLVFGGSVHECTSLRLRRGVKILMIKTIKLNRCIFLV